MTTIETFIFFTGCLSSSVFSGKVRHMIEVYISGICEPSPGGRAYYGFAVYHCSHNQDVIENTKLLFTHTKQYVPIVEGETSNYIAEYCALISALTWLRKNNLWSKEIVFFSDSTLLINQCNGYWKVNDGIYKRFAEKALSMISNLNKKQFIYVPVEFNLCEKLLKTYIERITK